MRETETHRCFKTTCVCIRKITVFTLTSFGIYTNRIFFSCVCIFFFSESGFLLVALAVLKLSSYGVVTPSVYRLL